MGLRRSITPWLLGGASLSLGAALTLVGVEPALSAGETYSQADPAVQAGMGVIMQSRCGNCHIIPGIPHADGNFGPDLGPHDDIPPVAGRNPLAIYPHGSVPNNSQDDLAAWLAHPTDLKPGTAMPDLGLSQDDAEAAAAYLYAIQPDGSVAGMDDSAAAPTPDSGGSGG